MKKFTFLILMMSLALLVTGCQTTPQTEERPGETQDLPYSNGPTNPPSVKGPTAAPPGGDSTTQTPTQNEDAATSKDASTQVQPQAVTETETVRYTLPETKNPDFKQ